MTNPSPQNGTQDVPTKVFEKFVLALEEDGLYAELVARFRKILLEDETLTETALKDAVFGEESGP